MILVALVIKIILLPFQMKSKRGMIQQARLQPKVAELQKKHGTNKAKINEETMKLYKEAGVNPASGCIWGFLPLPIMLALFQVIRQPITIMMGVAEEEFAKITELLGTMGFDPGNISSYYVQIAQSQFISNNFSRFRDLSESLRQINFNFLNLNFGITPQWDFLWNANLELYGTWFAGFVLFLIPLISGGMQFLATHLNRKMNPPAAVVEGQAKSMNTMMMFMPLISVYIAFITPVALGFYWTISTVFQIIQDVWLTKVYTKKIEADEALKNEERERKEAELEAKRLETERRKAEGLVERNPNTAKRKKQKSGKQEHIEKAAEWQKKTAPVKEEAEYEPSRVGNRRYARGRAYDPDRYADSEETAVLALEEAAEDTAADIDDISAGESDSAGQDYEYNADDSTNDEDDYVDDEEYDEDSDDEDYEDDDSEDEDYEDDDSEDEDYEDDDSDDEDSDDEDYEDNEDDEDDEDEYTDD